MKDLVNSINLSKETVDRFQHQGFLRIRRLFSDAGIAYIRQLTHQALSAHGQPIARKDQKNVGIQSSADFSNYLFDIGNNDETMQAIAGFGHIQSIFKQVVGEELLFTQGLAFEIESNRSKGLDWHFGFRSFNYIQPRDLGFTIWLPLNEIKAETEHGGMYIVSEEVYSGRDESKLLADIYLRHNDEQIVTDSLNKITEFVEVRDDLLERNRIEYSFELGDALLFDRYVLHRSSPLVGSEGRKRAAFVFRFITSKALYSPELMRGHNAVNAMLGFENPTRYGEQFNDVDPGDPVSVSAVWASN